MSESKDRMRGRLESDTDEVIVRHIYAPKLESELQEMPYLTEANLAHVIMLYRQDIIEESDAQDLLEILLRLDRRGCSLLDVDEGLEGLYYNYERYLIAELGSRTGGRLHTARSRNDLGATMSRMRVRDLILDVLEGLIRFRTTLADRAEAETETIITGHTHMQPAQPITVGHYLAGIEHAVARAAGQFLHTYELTNLCCLGAGALAGTGFPIDRQLTAELLAFDGFVENTVDAVAARDYLLAFFSDMACLSITLSRLAQDLYMWYSYEFGIIDLPDSLAGTSSIMPQKKNPGILESPRGRLSHVLGGLVSALTAMKNTNYTNVTDVNSQSFHHLIDSVQQVSSSVVLLEAAVAGMEIHEDRALRMASSNFSTVTQLADTLVEQEGYSFREAHHIVGIVVHRAISRGLEATDVNRGFIDEVVREELGWSIRLSDEQVTAALDPRQNVEARCHPGGPAPAAVVKSLSKTRDELADDEVHISSLRERIRGARRKLRKAAREITDEGSGAGGKKGSS